jgi:hypothetical protein
MLRKKRGQTVVLVLLLSLMGLTLGLSQVSRSLSDLKQVTYVDAGTKAFAGAEAGLQYALSNLTTKINNNESISTDCTTNIPATSALNLGSNFSSVTYTLCANSSATVFYPAVPSDEAREIDLSPALGVNGVTGVNVAWYNATNSNTALEIIAVVDNNFNLRRYFYDPTNPVGTGFLSSYQVGSGGCTNTNLINSNGRCTSPSAGSPAIPISLPAYKLLRIKPLAGVNGGPTDIAVISFGTTPRILGPATYTVSATATMVNGTVKKLEVIKTPPALPGVFDNGFFSSGSISKN